MKTIGRLERNTAVWQADFNAARDENGQYTATRSFICDSRDVHPLLPAKGDPCSKEGWEILQLVSLTVTDVQGSGSGWSQVICNYRGTQYEFDGDEGTDLVPTYNTSIVAQSEPIESHPNFKDLSASDWTNAQWYRDNKIIRDTTDPTKFKRSGYDEEKNKFDFTEDFVPSDELKQLFENYDKGFTQYFAPRITHTMRYSSNQQLSASTMNAIGKIDTPSNAPPAGTGRNWLFMGADSEQSGDVYQIELEWMLSGPEGWDTDYYT